MSTSLEDILRKIIKEQTVYKSVRLINNCLIIVLNDGQILTKEPATIEDFNAIKDASSTIKIKEVVGMEEEKDEKSTQKTMGEMKKIIKKRMVKFK